MPAETISSRASFSDNIAPEIPCRYPRAYANRNAHQKRTKQPRGSEAKIPPSEPALSDYLIAMSLNAALIPSATSPGLPAAQNIFVNAVRYQRAVVLARDVVFLTTIASIPSIMVIAALVEH